MPSPTSCLLSLNLSTTNDEYTHQETFKFVMSLLAMSLVQVRGKWVGIPIGCKTAWCVWARFRRAMVGTVYEWGSCWPRALSIEILSMSGSG